MLSFVLFVTMCALARASSSLSLGPTYHPAHTEVRDALCYVGDNAPAELPQVSVFAERTGKWRRNKDPNDSPAEYYCDQMAPNRVNGEQTNCAYTEAENNVVHLTTSAEGDANLANEYQVTCSFVVIIVDECPVVEDASGDSSEDSDSDSDSDSGNGSGSGSGNGNGSGSDSDSDSSDGYHGRDYRFGGRFWAWISWSWPGKGSRPSYWNQHKRQDDFVSCESRTSVGACLNSCDPSVPTGGCECLFDLPLGGNLTAEGDCPPGVQCCWNLPCSAHSGQFGGNELQCTLRGGGEETDEGLVPNNCEFSPDGECTCVDPKTETDDASSAPFDCDCNSLSVEEWLEQGAQGTCPAFGTGGGDSETDPDTDADGALAAAKVALNVALRIGSENVLQFLASCDVEILRVEGSETSRICERIFRAFNRNQVRAYRRATKNGCDFVLYPGHAPAARLVAEDALTAEDVAQLDTFTVITDVIEDSASPLAAAAGLAVAVGAATL